MRELRDLIRKLGGDAGPPCQYHWPLFDFLLFLIDSVIPSDTVGTCVDE